MKEMMKIVALGLLVMVAFVGCSKQPTAEIDAAKAAVDAVIAEGAEKYAPEDAKKLNDDLAAAMSEIKAQEGKFMKSYTNATAMLAKLKTDAEQLKTNLPAKKEEAKNNAMAAEDTAKTAVAEAAALLAKAPKGKGSKADIEAMRSDIKGLEESLAEVKTLIETEDYANAAAKATAIKDKAAEVSEQIKMAMEKVGAKK